MKRPVLFCASFLLSTFLFSQEYAYSFSGTVTIELQEKLKNEILKMPQVASCDFKIKPDKNVGEIVFYIEPKTVRSESSEEFSPVLIKNLFIEHNLSPLDFRLIK